MPNRHATATAAFGLVSVLALVAGSADATVFAAWKVAHVAYGDTLNVRKYPSNGSQKQSAYPNGTILQLTGKCTGGVDLLDIAEEPKAVQEQAVRYSWCQVWHDPARNGHYVTGWVYGKYITPH